MAPYNTYPCTDGHVAIFTSAERHWQSMCGLLGRPDLAKNPEYASTVGRARNMAEIDDIVGAWTITQSKDEVLRLLNEAHVPCAPVKTAREVAHDPHLEARGFWVDIEHPRRAPRACRSRPSACMPAANRRSRSPRRRWASTPRRCSPSCAGSRRRSWRRCGRSASPSR
jgi:formyl-CoA transferase